MDNQSLYDRYHRQLILKGFGETAQQKLLQSKLLVIGAGGLGCPALQYLAAAGIGTIGIADDDVISIDNLHRQVLYQTGDVGLLKAERAAFYLRQLNPGIKIIAYPERLTVNNALDILSGYDVIIDGTDNFASRYLINDACVLLDKPLVYGAVSQYEGQVAVFNAGHARVNYRDLFPQPPKDGEVASCEEAGVLGVLPGIIGSMQANEAIKLVAGIGQPLVNRLLTYNSLTNVTYDLALSARKETASLIPADKTTFMQMDYEWLCSTAGNDVMEIGSDELVAFLQQGNATIIDVREEGEIPLLDEVHCMKIPLSGFRENVPEITTDAIILLCQSGKRSRQAARWLMDDFGTSKKIFSLRGGVLAWKQFQQKSS